jgi:hypothetical protein
MPKKHIENGRYVFYALKEGRDVKLRNNFFYVIDQGCQTYGTHAQSGTREDFLCKRHFLLSQFLNSVLPLQRLYTVKNMRSVLQSSFQA